MEVACQHCGKVSGILRAEGESDGTIGARLSGIDWIVRLPVLVGITEWLFTCSDPCMKSLMSAKFAEHGVSQDDIARATEITDRVKERIPAMAKETCEAVGRLHKSLLAR